jgi:hypothetical protein
MRHIGRISDHLRLVANHLLWVWCDHPAFATVGAVSQNGGAVERVTAPSRARRLLSSARLHHRRWTSERELTHAIYGTVVGAAAMATAGAHGTLGQIIVTVLVTVTVYWAAERYAEVLAAAVHGPGRRSRMAQALRRGWPTIEAAYTPLVVLVVFVLITGQLRSGVLAALGVSTGMLSGLGYVAARRTGAARPAALAGAAGSAALGITVILLKIFLH